MLIYKYLNVFSRATVSKYITWKPDLTQRTQIDLSWDYDWNNSGIKKVIIDLSNADERKEISARFVIAPELSKVKSDWSNLIIKDHESLIFKDIKRIEISNRYYELVLTKFDIDTPVLEKLPQVMFESKHSKQEESEKNIISVSLYEIILAFKEKTKNDQNSYSVSLISNLLDKIDSTQLHRWGYRYDYQTRTLRNVSDQSNMTTVLTEVAQATLREGATQEKKIIDIITTSGFKGDLTVEGDKPSVILDKIIEEMPPDKDSTLYLSDLKYNQKPSPRRSILI